MEIHLKEKPIKPVLIEGFPGFGLIGTIVTEYLIDHLQCKCVGKCWFEELPASIAIHDEKLVNPIGLFYNKANNLMIVHSISPTAGVEWKAADVIREISTKVNAKEIICIEGVGTTVDTGKHDVFFYASMGAAKKKLNGIGLNPLKEGIILGVTSALMVKTNLPLTCLFAETHSALPDSSAAAKVIECLDKYLGLKVDTAPLLKQAEKFEEKLKNMLEQGQKATEAAEKKQLSYVG
jgi:uncharacterized protein